MAKAKIKANTNTKVKLNNWVIVAVVVVAVLAIVGGIACVNIYLNPSNVSVSENQTNVQINKGQEFTIKLSSNATTGYSWNVDDVYDKTIITKISSVYKAPNTDLTGAPGEEWWVFRGTSTGTTSLTFNYARSWETGVSPINSKTFNITVR